MTIWDGTGKVHPKTGGEGRHRLRGPASSSRSEKGAAGREDIRPEIDRTVLRKLLLDAVPHNPTSSSGTTLCPPSARSEMGSTNSCSPTAPRRTICDLLVGADGASSRVRPLLSPAAAPEFLGVNGAEISLAPETTKLPALADTVAHVGQGGLMALQDARMLGVRRSGDGRIRTYAWLRAPADWTIPTTDVARARAVLRAHYAGWAEWLLKLIDYCDEGAIYPRTLYTLPIGHKWAHVPGVTLLGDAAHLMSPFAGAGANLALFDGLELGLALADLK